RLLGKSTEKGYKKEGPDPLFDNVNVVKFLDKEAFIIKQKVEVVDASKPVSGYLTFMTCDNNRCLPPEDVDFSLTFDKATTGAAKADEKTAVVAAEENKPVIAASDTTKKDTAMATAASAAPVKARIENGIIDQLIPALYNTFKKPRASCDDGVVQNTGYLWTFIFGFLGGLFALLTPCVFPMIPITVSFFTKDTKRKGWVNGLIYGASIIVIYVLLGLLITAVFGPEALNRLSTNWIANTLFFIIFIVFALSFFGFYEITLPSSWSTKSDQMADKGGLLGIFFMAFTLALVSFSCTGPIIGSALVTAASKGEYMGPFLVMFGFSLALALPFGLFAAFPAWLNTLPKSGSWMNSVKVV
ncbi:MAG TPA: cytochrome c biogenesis protein CcdA, partial [Saprospiraceae bacterium]|nr:cytochrome c biogenesis protein CcdA [Saprospiraceae bacterium]